MRKGLLAFLFILVVFVSGCLRGPSTPTGTTSASHSSSSTPIPPQEEKAPLEFLYPESPKVINWSYEEAYRFFVSNYSDVPYSQYGNITVDYYGGVFHGRYEFVLTNFTSGTPLYLTLPTTPRSPITLNITIEGVPLNLSRVNRYRFIIPEEMGVGVEVYVVNVSTSLTTLRGVAEYKFYYPENKDYLLSLISWGMGLGTDFSWWEFASRNVSITVIPRFPKDTVFVLIRKGVIRSGMEVTYSDHLYPYVGFILHIPNLEWRSFEWNGVNFTVYFTPSTYSDEGFELVKKELIFAVDFYRNMTGILLPPERLDVMFYPGFTTSMVSHFSTEVATANFGHVIIIGSANNMKHFALNRPSLVFHEVAHEWVGHYARDYIGIKEPLATFMEMDAYGKWDPDDYLSWLNDNEYSTVRYGNGATFYDTLMNSRRYSLSQLKWGMYYRGAFTLRSLRFVLGEENFSRVFLGLLERFHVTPCKNITMFEDTIEELSGENLDWFFAEWFNSTLFPDYNVTNLSVERNGGDYTFSFTITDASNFTMPVPVRVYLEDGSSKDYRIWVNSTATVNLELPEKPVKIVIDPNEIMANVNRKFEVDGIQVEVN